MINVSIFQLTTCSLYKCHSPLVEIWVAFYSVRLLQFQSKHICFIFAGRSQQDTSNRASRLLQTDRWVASINVQRCAWQERWLTVKALAKSLRPGSTTIVVWTKSAVDKKSNCIVIDLRWTCRP